MKERKNCEVIQDLLPNYIENLTKEETNQYIKEHINTCENCKKTLENMKEEYFKENKGREKQEINYLKKYSKKLKVLKFIISIIIILLFIIVGRKIIIIKYLQKQISQYLEITNYYMKVCSYKGDSISIEECFVNGNRYVYSIHHLDENHNQKLSTFANININNIYIDDNGYKTAILNTEGLSKIEVLNVLKTSNFIEFIRIAFTSKIATENCNGKECYKIDYYPSNIVTEKGNAIIYVDKETGLIVRMLSGKDVSENGEIINLISDYYYEFNNVTEEDMKEPDLTQYEIK